MKRAAISAWVLRAVLVRATAGLTGRPLAVRAMAGSEVCVRGVVGCPVAVRATAGTGPVGASAGDPRSGVCVCDGVTPGADARLTADRTPERGAAFGIVGWPGLLMEPASGRGVAVRGISGSEALRNPVGSDVGGRDRIGSPVDVREVTGSDVCARDPSGLSVPVHGCAGSAV